MKNLISKNPFIKKSIQLIRYCRLILRRKIATRISAELDLRRHIWELKRKRVRLFVPHFLHWFYSRILGCSLWVWMPKSDAQKQGCCCYQGHPLWYREYKLSERKRKASSFKETTKEKKNTKREFVHWIEFRNIEENSTYIEIDT